MLHGFQENKDKKWVVLSTTKEMALSIGRRRDRDPIMAEVRALKAYRGGVVFRMAGDLLYLVKSLEPRWMNIPPLPCELEKKGPVSAHTPGRMAEFGRKKGLKDEASISIGQVGSFILGDMPPDYMELSETVKKRRKDRGRGDKKWGKAVDKRNRRAKS